MSEQSLTAKRVIYSGHVQGVGFRWTTQGVARGFAVTGFVRNLRDGRVEIFVGAEGEALQNFRRQIEQGPRRSHVEELDVNEMEEEIKDEIFHVKEDGSEPWSQNS